MHSELLPNVQRTPGKTKDEQGDYAKRWTQVSWPVQQQQGEFENLGTFKGAATQVRIIFYSYNTRANIFLIPSVLSSAKAVECPLFSQVRI